MTLRFVISYLKQHWGLTLSLTLISTLTLAFFTKTNVFYVVPYRDMLIGIYPPDKIIQLLISPWSPENFGIPASVSMLYIFLYGLEKLLSPVKAFVIYTLMPYIITVLVTYYVLHRQFNISDEFLLLIFSTIASINWFTLYSFGSSYIIYYYLGSLLILGTLYRIYNEENFIMRYVIIRLTIAMLLASIGWGLPGLVLLVIFLMFNLPMLISKPKFLFKFVLSMFISLLIALAIMSPFIYQFLFGTIYYGFENYATRAGYLPVGYETWLDVLMPYYFEKYLGNIIKIFMLPFDPNLENPIYVISVVIVTILIFDALINSKSFKRELKLFFIYQLLYISLIASIIFLIVSGNGFINVLYSFLPFLSVLKTVTNYMVILLSLIHI